MSIDTRVKKIYKHSTSIKPYKHIKFITSNIIYIKTSNNTQCIAEIKDNQVNGKIKIYDIFGYCFQGKYKNNKPCDNGILFSKCGSTCEGYFADGKLKKKCRIIQNEYQSLTPNYFNKILQKLHTDIFDT
jgi:hypothetical protein